MLERNSKNKWSKEEDIKLEELVKKNTPTKNIAFRLKRSISSIYKRKYLIKMTKKNEKKTQ